MWGDYMKEEERLPETVGKTGKDDESRVSCMDGKLMVKTNGGIWQLSPSLVGLKYLITSGNSFCEVMVEVSRELVWLRWFQIGQRNLPSGLSLKNLRVLELYEKNDMFFKKAEHHLEKLWGETEGEAPVQLRELIISHCRNFQGFPKSIGHLKHLKKIVIIASWNVRSLPNEFCLLQSLEHLVFHCPLLSLPNNFGNPSNLRYLNLADCSFERLPVSLKNLMLLEYLNLEFCSLLEFTSEDLNFMENMTKLEFLSLSGCEELEDLPRHITTQASLRELYFSDTSLRELPNNIGQLSKMRKMDVTVMSTSLPTSFGGLSSLTQLAIKSCPKLERLPDSFGGLPSLTILSIEDCSKLEGLPDSFGDLSSLTNLDIKRCPQLEILPESIGQLNNPLKLSICSCPISELNFGTASLTFGPSKVKDIQLIETKVCMISFSEDCCPHLKSLSISDNHHLKEIEALPRNLESITLKDCEMLKNIPSFAQLTSLRKFQLFGCYGIEKIEGIENCTGLTELRVDTCWEVPGIESLEHMQNLKELEFRANKGSVIERCIQTIQKWPDETITIFTRALPQAASVLVSLVSPNLVIANSISNQKINSHPQLVMKRSSNCEAFILCVVTNCLSSQMTMYIDNGWSRPSVIKLEKGRWAWENGGEEDKVEQGLVMSGEEQTVMVAFRSLLPDDGYRTSFDDVKSGRLQVLVKSAGNSFCACRPSEWNRLSSP
ncbi:hypothetical protein SUGI_0674930 [Cryptomeria japonica]|nr:hypothetical protein SUGI_0674930 [Cryptomeria japonica]